MEMKPRIKKDGEFWFCGGLFVAPWYIDWVSGRTPQEAYDNWVRMSGNSRTQNNCI
jgi:hypothetical protein